MSDDVAPELQDQPTDQPEAPETDQPTNDQPESFTDFVPSQIPDDADREWLAERYNQMQGDYSRKTMEIGEVRREAEQLRQLRDALQNPQVAPAVLAQLGYDERKILEMFGYQPGEDEEPEFSDPDERIARLEQTLAQQQAAAQAQQQEQLVTDYIAGEIVAVEKDFKKKNGREFTADEQSLLDAYARQFAKDSPAGRVPDVQGAYGLLNGALSSHGKALLDPKRNVPRPPGGGRPATRTVDPSKETREERLARMADAIEQANASGQ